MNETTEYRTQDQWNEICDSAVNGNWSTARKEVEEYGFYVEDLIKYHKQDIGCGVAIITAYDIARLSSDL